MERIHATCVEWDGVGILLQGPSGAGKSDLALRLIDAGAHLVADDQVVLAREGTVLIARAPEPLAGLLEVRGIGIVRLAHRASARVGVVVDLDPSLAIERLPEPAEVEVLGVRVASVALSAFEASAPAKLRLVVRGLDLHSGS